VRRFSASNSDKFKGYVIISFIKFKEGYVIISSIAAAGIPGAAFSSSGNIQPRRVYKF
jgi:hypothetical protein